MKITIFGTGYVGLVTGTCFAEVGNDVLCIDIDDDKVSQLQQGNIPIYEPGLEQLVRTNAQYGRLKFSTDIAEGVRHGLCLFIAVGTPPDEDGSADLRHVLAVAMDIGRTMDNYRVIINKSTVPVGTADKVRETVNRELQRRNSDIEFDVVSNPEFLKEGAAIDDFMKPDRIIIGTDSHRSAEVIRNLYAPYNRNHDRVIEMDIRSAELTKYAANAILATKISFMNEVANLAERLGADIEHVRIGIGSDPRIGYDFIYPGCGYGGSCFPKDVRALIHIAKTTGYDSELLTAVEAVNDRQKNILFEKIHAHFNGELNGRTLALWGLSFKPNTDDMREAPSRSLMEALWKNGAMIRAYDPGAMGQARQIYGDRPDLRYCESALEALEGADALAIVTEWKEFRSPDPGIMSKLMNQAVIFDGRNLFEPAFMETRGFRYFGIGRGCNEEPNPPTLHQDNGTSD